MSYETESGDRNPTSEDRRIANDMRYDLTVLFLDEMQNNSLDASGVMRDLHKELSEIPPGHQGVVHDLLRTSIHENANELNEQVVGVNKLLFETEALFKHKK